MARPRKRRNRRKPDRSSGRLRHLLAGLASLLVVAATGTACVLAHDMLTQCRYFEAARIDVSGNRRLTVGEVCGQAALRPGVNILKVNLVTVRNRLLAHPYIAAASIRRRLPDAIEIRIGEHRPLAVVDLGRQFLINQRGDVFKERTGDDPGRLPVIRGLRFTDLQVGNAPATAAWQAVREVLRLGAEAGSVIPNARIREIRVDRQSGLTVCGLDGIEAVHIGFDAYADKYRRLRTVMHYLAGNPPRFSGLKAIHIVNLNRVILTPAGVSGSPREKGKEV